MVPGVSWIPKPLFEGRKNLWCRLFDHKFKLVSRMKSVGAFSGEERWADKYVCRRCGKEDESVNDYFSLGTFVVERK
jgi:hypothetical protein